MGHLVGKRKFLLGNNFSKNACEKLWDKLKEHALLIKKG